MRASHLFPCLILTAACADDPAAEIELLVPVDPTEGGLTIEVASAVGAGEVHVPVRLVNQYGMSVPGGSVSVRAWGVGVVQAHQTS